MPLHHSSGTAIYNREHGKCHHNSLYPGATQKIRSKAIIGQTDNGKYSGFYHRYRMKQCCYWRRCHTCVRKPGSHRPHSCFYAKSHTCNQVHYQKQLLFISNLIQIQYSAHDKVKLIPIYHQKDNANQGKGSSAKRIIQIFSGCMNGLTAQTVQNQRHCYQSQQFIKEIHAKHV